MSAHPYKTGAKVIALSLAALALAVFVAVAAAWGVHEFGPSDNHISRGFSTTTVVGTGDFINVDNLGVLRPVPPLEILKANEKFDPASNKIALALVKTTSITTRLLPGNQISFPAPYNATTSNVLFVQREDFADGTSIFTSFLAEPDRTYPFELNVKDEQYIPIGGKVFLVTLQDIRLNGTRANGDYRYTFQIQEK